MYAVRIRGFGIMTEMSITNRRRRRNNLHTVTPCILTFSARSGVSDRQADIISTVACIQMPWILIGRIITITEVPIVMASCWISRRIKMDAIRIRGFRIMTEMSIANRRRRGCNFNSIALGNPAGSCRSRITHCKTHGVSACRSIKMPRKNIGRRASVTESPIVMRADRVRKMIKMNTVRISPWIMNEITIANGRWRIGNKNAVAMALFTTS